MAVRLYKALILICSLTQLIACASSPTTSSTDRAVYHDAAFNDHNPAPQNIAPPATAPEATVDPVYIRTQADYFFAMGESYSLDGNHQKAVESFKMVLVYDPDSAHVPLRLAAEYVKMGMISEALTQAEISVKKNPKNVDAHLLLGGLYSNLKTYNKALKEYEIVLKLNPEDVDAPLYMGAVYAEQKQFDKAVRLFESLAKNPDYSSPHLAYYYIGRVRVEQGGSAYMRAAEEAYKKALHIKPEHIDSVLALSSLYAKLGQEPRGVSLLKEFQREYGPSLRVAEVLSQKYLEAEDYGPAYEQLEILENNADDTLGIKVKMALVLIEQKKYEPAVAKLHEILRAVPDSDKIRFYLAAIYEETNQVDLAVEHFLKIPAGSQFYPDSVVHAAYLLKQSKKLSTATDLVKKGLGERPEVPQFYAIYASLLDEEKKFDDAIEILETAVKKFPENSQVRFFLGTAYDRVGKKDLVLSEMQKVIDLDPNHVQGLNYLAFTYADNNQSLDEAEKLARRAIELEPKDGYILDTLGWILYKKGDVSEAVKWLESAQKAQPTESIIAEHLGDAYYKLQLVQKAKIMYQRAVENESDEQKQNEIRAKITAVEKQEVPSRFPASVPHK